MEGGRGSGKGLKCTLMVSELIVDPWIDWGGTGGIFHSKISFQTLPTICLAFFVKVRLGWPRF